MKTVLAALALLSATVVSRLVGQGDDESARKTLAGLRGVYVAVGISDSDEVRRDGQPQPGPAVPPGGAPVRLGERVEAHARLTDSALHCAKGVLRNYGNMSSPTVLFVLDEVTRHGEPQRGDWGAMTALGPGMAGEVALLQW